MPTPDDLNETDKPNRPRLPLQLLVTLGGMAALSWEVLWQHEASLAFGASARGTAVTLAVTMAGMTLGSLGMGRVMKQRILLRPSRIYGGLEIVIGLSGLIMPFGFGALESLDTAIFHLSPGLATPAHALGIALLLGPPTLAMGATVPVFKAMSHRYHVPVSMLYGLNTGGAALGVLLLSFAVLPELGVFKTAVSVAGINFCVGLAAIALSRFQTKVGDSDSVPPLQTIKPRLSFGVAQLVVFTTGFTTFGLEVAWFRSLRAAFWNTSGTFAIVLAAVLIPLALGARAVPWLRRRGVTPGGMLACAGISILISTPLIERMDLFKLYAGESTAYFEVMLLWLGLSLATMGPAMFFLGMALPWCLDEYDEPVAAGRLYGINTFGAVAGSLVTAWVLLPEVGFARAAWLLGVVVVILAVATVSQRRLIVLAVSAGALALAVSMTSSPGRDRAYGSNKPGAKHVVTVEEGPDSTISVIEVLGGTRMLMIDGFVAADDNKMGNQYMEWMGRLPALLHKDPKDALVICFGTGRTSNSVRLEEVESLDIVDLNAAVFNVAHLFDINQGVLDDPRTRFHVMDGRAWLRRTPRKYDVVTLEPMPPNFSGVNALYSREFYQLVAERMKPGGVAAQWLPFHLVNVDHATAIAATFNAVFPDSILWLDPASGTGILLGRTEIVDAPLGRNWPGLDRDIHRPLTQSEVRRAVRLYEDNFVAYANTGRIITDDNLLLSFSQIRNGTRGKWAAKVAPANHFLLEKFSDRPAFLMSPEERTRRAKAELEHIRRPRIR